MAAHSLRNQSLDVLRGIAILLVLGYHYSYVEIWARAGWIGVDLFFVLSGFLISGLLFREYRRFGNIRTVRFLIRRGFKIYPAFCALMLSTAVYCLVTQGYIPRGILGELSFTQNYWLHLWPHTWSLAVEEHFYWMLPLLLLVMTRKSKDKKNPFSGIPWVFGFLAVACLALRVLDARWGFSPSVIEHSTHLRIDSLFAGVTLGYYRHFRPNWFARVARKPLWLPGLVLVLPAFVFPAGTLLMDTIGFTSLYVGFGCILVWSVDRQSSQRFAARALAWTGRYSYSIYLWQFPIGFLVFSSPRTFPLFLFFLVTAIGFGAGMSRLVEVPHLKLRDKFFPSRTRLAEVKALPVAKPASPRWAVAG